MTTGRRKPTDIVQLKLRLREDLRRKLEREAARKKHSLNTEMVERLNESFSRDAAEVVTEAMARDFHARVDRLTEEIKEWRRSGKGRFISISERDEDGEEITVSAHREEQK
jgi:hypothetical protein